MASPSQNWDEDAAAVDPSYEPRPGHRLPGWTVDALLDEGKVDEARAELERLLQEGIDSGPGIEITPEFWDQLREHGRQAAARRR